MTSPGQTVKTGAVVGPGDPRGLDARVVGVKAANLMRLSESGFRVPQGFVVTTDACDQIRSRGEVPGDVWGEIRLHLDELGAGPVAVRSSGTAEDLAGASFAGQYESVLGVEGHDAVAGAIARCVASATSDQVRAYRGSDAPAPMAVLIQRLVPADAAGVAFTANPITGDDEVLVSAVTGLGDRLVSGEATPDEWVVRGGDVTAVRSSEGALDRERVGEVARLAREVERLFDAPQDIEWAVADGVVFLLQARPITALPVDPHLEAPTVGFWMKDDSHWPTPLTPFGASVYLPALSDARPPMAEFGLMAEGVEQRSWGGEVYVRVIPLGGKDRKAPPAWAVRLALRVAPPLRRRARAAEEGLATGLPERYLVRWEGEWRPAFVDEFRALRSVDLTALADDELVEHLERAKDLLRRGADLHFRLAAPYHLALYELSEACRELLGWDAVRSLSLLTGTSVASSEPGRELQALARRLAADPVVLAELAEPAADPLAQLRRCAPWVAAALEDYLERFGHRTLNYDPGEPTWFERPAVVAGLLVEQALDVGANRPATSEPPSALAEARAELSSRSELDRDRFEGALDYAQRAYSLRDDNVLVVDCQPSALLRYSALEIGRRLVERGALAQAPDAVLLDEAELRRALLGPETGDLRPLVARRRAERAWVSAHPGPLTYGEVPAPPPDLALLPPALRKVHVAFLQGVGLMMSPSTPQDASNELRGVPGSPGRYSGVARVVHDETEFAKLRPGDVLVAPVTSPPWSVLFLRAGAVVTDGGGVLSHTAVIAREYGVPAVLATGEATRRLRDGDLVTVDGTSGVVSIGPPVVDSVGPTSTMAH